jgi:hypothetical protein
LHRGRYRSINGGESLIISSVIPVIFVNVSGRTTPGCAIELETIYLLQLLVQLDPSKLNQVRLVSERRNVRLQ